MERNALAAAALILASCDTAGPPPPYAEPFPPPSSECPISASRDWAAWINAMPGPNARPTLIATGRVVTPTGGFQVALDPDLRIAESHPAQAFATLRVTPPSGPATQALVTHEVRWEWPVSQPIGRLVVSCGDKTIADISPLQTAY